MLTLFVSIDIRPADATKISMTWGNLDNLGNNPFNSTECYREETICNNINNMFSSSWTHNNGYGGYTTPSNVYFTLDYVANPSNNVDWSTAFWVGDFTHPYGNTVPAPYGYFGCFTNTTYSYVWDYDIYNSATSNGVRSSKNYFTFMWTCANGGLYWSTPQGAYSVILGIIFPYTQTSMPAGVPVNTNTYYGYRVNSSHIVGMPYAWTGTTSMSTNGYTNPSGSYAYMGWENTSPFMGDKPPAGSSTTSYEYLFFVYYFYSYATGQVTGYHETINDSLDYAARMTFGKDSSNNEYTFSTSILNKGQWRATGNNWFYCRMRVFGNGNVILPY